MCEPGQQARIRHLSLSDLMPPTEDYMTYEGSMTQPGCHETITWIVMNKPVYVTVEQVTQVTSELPIANVENVFSKI